MKHLFESATNTFLQNDGHWAEASPSQYAWGDDGEFQMNGMNHSPDCPCHLMVAFACTLCGVVTEVPADEAGEAQSMVAWCDRCSGSDDGESLTEEEEELRRVKFTRI